VPGTAVFLTGNLDFVPNALLHNLKHNKVLHEQVFFVNVRTLAFPQAKPEERATAEQVAPGVYKVSLCYGFMESPNVPRALERLSAQGVEFKPMQTSYFLGRETVVAASLPKLRFIRRWMFLFMARNAVSATEFFRIPSDRVVELGVRIAI
jgi:KUP system potassium uptake protein